MIVCPNCNHSNPDGANQCEACYTPLPMTTSCPNCGAPVQTDATFCGQCGSSLKPSAQPDIPQGGTPQSTNQELTSSSLPFPEPIPHSPVPATVVSQQSGTPDEASISSSIPTPEPSTEPAGGSSSPAPTPHSPAPTLLQQQTARLLHTQTNTTIELPPELSVIHVGKPNDQIPPDIDVSGFPNSEIVSRIHADIRMEGDAYYIEDVGSANGTYVNHNFLPNGNRHRLRPGDRISLGKGDLMTFLFQVS
ncbi:MAG: FHA domain-containing protein [Chamaesiphon sp.]